MFLTKHGVSEKEDAMNNRTEGSNKFCITFFFFFFFLYFSTSQLHRDLPARRCMWYSDYNKGWCKGEGVMLVILLLILNNLCDGLFTISNPILQGLMIITFLLLYFPHKKYIF